MKFITLALMALLLTACGESPLWNHSMEKAGLDNDFFETRGEGYHFSKSKFSFSLSWVVGPVKGENKFIVKSWNDELGTLNGPYQDLPNKFHVYLWMPDMGHGSAPVKLKKTATGEYEVSNAYFIMPGKWEVYFQILNAKDEVLDEVVLPITL